MRSSLVLLAIAGCSSPSVVVDARRDDAPRDAPGSSCRLLDSDAGMYDGPGCGCAVGDHACPGCSGAKGPCRSCGGGIGCGEGVIVSASCDGPEDCAAGMVCCDDIGGPSCEPSCPSSIRCHAGGDCTNGDVCCPDPTWGHLCKPSC